MVTPARILLLPLATALVLAPSARAQTIDGLRPPAGLEDEAASDIAAPPIRPKTTTLEVPPTPPPAPPRAKVTTLEVDPAPPLPIPEPAPGALEPADPYLAQGLDLGGLRLYPTLGVGIAVTDNAFNTTRDREEAIGLRLAPRLRLESEWVRHSFVAAAAGDLVFYDTDQGADTREAQADARLRLDARRTTALELDALYRLDQTSAAGRDVPDAADGFRTEHDIAGSAALIHRGGRIETRLRGGVAWNVFEDVDLIGGGQEDNSDRDYLQPEAALRVGYEVQPAFRPFAELAYRPRVHRERRDRNGLERDSHGLVGSLGLAFDDDPLWTGEAALTYTVRDYDDRALDTVEAVGVTGRVAWRPTDLTVLTLAASTSIAETSSPQEGGTRVHEVDVDVVHALREHIDLEAGLSFTHDDSDAEDDEVTIDADLGLRYRFNPWVAWTAGYSYTWFDSTGSDYTEHRIATGIEIRR